MERVLGWEGPDRPQQSSAGGAGGSQVGAGSPEVQEGPDVVVPGEGPKQLHHSGQVLLSTGREGETGHVTLHLPQPLRPPGSSSRGGEGVSGSVAGQTLSGPVLEPRRDRSDRLLVVTAGGGGWWCPEPGRKLTTSPWWSPCSSSLEGTPAGRPIRPLL